MTKEKILQTIIDLEKEKGTYDLTSDTDTELLFYELEKELNLNLNFGLYQRNNTDMDYWLQTEYYSYNLGKTIIWSHDAGNFDDANEVADYIITTTQEIKDFEARLPKLSPVAYIC